MILLIVIPVLLITSFILALFSLHDLETPPEVKRLMRKKEGVSGVILFLKKKIIHYSS